MPARPTGESRRESRITGEGQVTFPRSIIPKASLSHRAASRCEEGIVMREEGPVVDDP
jgi:hypothetical protein